MAARSEIALPEAGGEVRALVSAEGLPQPSCRNAKTAQHYPVMVDLFISISYVYTRVYPASEGGVGESASEWCEACRCRGFSCERYRHIRGSGREWTVEVAYTGDTQLLASIN